MGLHAGEMRCVSLESALEEVSQVLDTLLSKEHVQLQVIFLFPKSSEITQNENYLKAKKT